MKKTKIKFYPETEDTSVKEVETIHRDSSVVSDVEISEARDWLWSTLKEPVEASELGESFVNGFGRNNLVIFSRALELMRKQGLVEYFRLKEDGDWINFWVRKNTKGGDKD